MMHRYAKAGILIVALLMGVVAACEKEQPPPPQPWTYVSDSSPYRVTMPPDWRAEDPEQFNSFADFAARKGQLHLIVIPQRLPQLAGSAPPDALALKRAAVSVMEESIDDLEVLKQGPITVSGLDGHTVFSRGKVKGSPHHYITTYVTADEWGFQIIAWAPSDREKALTAEVDGLLDAWTFESASTGPDDADLNDAQR